MPTHKIPHNLLLIGTSVSHVVMIGGAILLYLAGKIDTAAFVAIMAAFGGAWSGVATALVTVKGSQAVTPSLDATPASGAGAAPVTTSSSAPVETA